MRPRIYQMEDLTESAEMLRNGPPAWFHAILFLLMGILAAAVPILAFVLMR